MPNVCEVCQEEALEAIPAFGQLRRVASDARSFARGGELFQCRGCRAVQKGNTPAWQSDCAKIYAEYDSYGLVNGLEQAVRSGDGKQFSLRSEIVLRHLRSVADLPMVGRVLDFGCGRGPTTRAASRVLPGWSIDGFDLDERALPMLSQISGFGRLYVGDPEDLPRNYDLIILMHALEHIPDPVGLLRRLSRHLAPGGRILCQVPDRLQNPYDLLIADHLLHFDPASLAGVGRNSGLPAKVVEGWVSKELTLIVSPDVRELPARASTAADMPAARQVEWLLQVADTARQATRGREFCIFGTSIAATWIASELDATPVLYLDEDTVKIGLKMDGVPIVAPDVAPRGSVVLLPMAPAIAASVAGRLSGLGLNFVDMPRYE
jgi:SAM-dependent methyltransferase